MVDNQNTLTVGSVPKKMMLFAIPIFFTTLFQQLYNVANSIVVGNFIGQQALAAVGSSSSLITLLIGFINGVALGAGVLVARLFGARDWQGLERAVHTTVALGLVSGAALTGLGVILSPQILQWMGTPEDVMQNSVLYFRVYFSGSLAIVLYNIGAGILQSVGDSRSPMKYLFIASFTNIVLVLLFVAVMRLGVGSAALATILSYSLSAFLTFRKLMSVEEPYHVNWRHIRFDRAMLREIVILGIPSGVQSSVVSLANVIVQSNINAFGSSVMAGSSAYQNIESFAFIPINSFSLALATFVSQNIGARQYGRARSGIKFGLLCGPLLAEGIGILIFALAPILIGFFNRQPEVITFGVAHARTVSLLYCLLAFSHCCAGTLRGMGRPIVPMTIMLAVWCVFRITYITVAVHFVPDIHVVYWAYPITWSISTVLFILCLRRLPFPRTAQSDLQSEESIAKKADAVGK